MVAAGWGLALLAAGLAALTAVRLRAHAELVARACHELRAPLTAAGLAVHALGDEVAGASRPLASLELELRRAGLALDDLAAAREGGRAGEIAEVLEAHEVVECVAASWSEVAVALGTELRLEPVPPGLFLRGDRLRLAQAVGNLVGNALEHGAGPVALRARPGGGPAVRFEVDDHGPGLPAPVATLAARPKAGRGRRGRGLAIASSVAQRHGGRVAAAPASHGARVVLELPQLTEAAGGRAHPGAPLANRVPWWRRLAP
jgi:signal transduction histidine kinase